MTAHKPMRTKSTDEPARAAAHGIVHRKMLFASAVLNGILAPPLIVLVVLLTDATVMGHRVNLPWMRRDGWICAFIMSAAAIGMFIA